MKKILLVIGLLALCSHIGLRAQFIDNKFDLNVSYGITIPIGPKTPGEQGFIMPSLFANYENNYYYSVEGTVAYHQHYSLGLAWNKTRFTDWVYNDREVFSGSSSSISGFGPLIKLHSKFKQTGIKNKVELFVTVSPYLAFVKSLKEENLFTVDRTFGSGGVLESDYTTFGTKINIGIAYALTQHLGLNLEIGGSYTKLKSHFYNDKNISLLNFGAGITFKFIKNKRYYL